MIIAFDIGAEGAVCYLRGDGDVEIERWGRKDRISEYYEIFKRAVKKGKEMGGRVVVYEEYWVSKFPRAGLRYAELVGLLKLICEEEGIRYEGIRGSAWKSKVGRAYKKVLEARVGRKVNEHEFCAWGIAYWYLNWKSKREIF
jgi:hypothetical protein